MRLNINSNKDLMNLSYSIFIISFVSLNLFLTFKFFFSIHLAIFEEPTNVLFWDDWSITNKDFIGSILKKHNEHQLSIPIAIAWLSYKITGLPGGFNLLFSSIFRLISLIFYFLTIKKLCNIDFKVMLNLNSFVITFFSIILGTIFFNYPISFRTLDWGFMLHWYIPLSILFVNGYLVFSNELNLKLFFKTYFLVFLSYLSGSQWIICLSALSILLFLKSIDNKKNLIINSLFSISSLSILDMIAGNSSSLTIEKIINFKFSFLFGIIWHTFNLSLPFIVISILIYSINTLSNSSFKKIIFDANFQFSTYIFSAGLVFSILVTLARGNNVDANIFSPSYPTFTGLIPFSIFTFLIFEIHKKTIFNSFGKIYFLIISLFFTFSLTSKFYLQKIGIIKQERYWQTYSFACRVIGNKFKKEGYQVKFDTSCGQTYPSDKKVFENMENPIFANGFNKIVFDSDISPNSNYEIIKLPILKGLPFIKKIKIKELKTEIPLQESYITVSNEKNQNALSKVVRVKIQNNKYM